MAVNYTENERVISAFLTNCKMTDIMRETGLSKRTVYKLKNDPEFQETIRERKTAIMAAVTNRMQSYLLKDAEVLQKIIENNAITPQTRVYAISVLFNQFKDMMQVTDIAQRLDTLQRAFKDGFVPV